MLHPLGFTTLSNQSADFNCLPDTHYIVTNTAVATTIKGLLPDPAKCKGAIVEVSRGDTLDVVNPTTLDYSGTMHSADHCYKTARVYSNGAQWCK